MIKIISGELYIYINTDLGGKMCDPFLKIEFLIIKMGSSLNYQQIKYFLGPANTFET